MSLRASTATLETIFQKQNHHKIITQFLMLVLLITLADFFFFGRVIGITLPLFATIVAICAYAVRNHHQQRKGKYIFFLIPLFSILPAIETLNYLSASLCVMGLIIFVLAINNTYQRTFMSWLKLFFSFIIYAPGRFPIDVMLAHQKITRTTNMHQWLNKLTAIVFIPLLFTLGFLFLFTIANPILSLWFSNFDLLNIIKSINFYRVIFWLAIALVLWPFIRVSKRIFLENRNDAEKEGPQQEQTEKQLQSQNPYFTTSSITLSFILFNALFAIQNYMDILYLWSDRTLPAGITYSQYVHRGTYTLILTTLLAAAFILFTMNKNRETSITPLTKGLIYLWNAQNIILLISTVMRMDLYIDAYDLTYLRLSVLIWIFLVMIGLALIFARLIMNLPNIWLIKANAISLFLVLYITSFANLPRIISDYNVQVAINHPTKNIDIDYLVSLGEQALPAMKKLHLHYESGGHIPNYFKIHRIKRLLNHYVITDQSQLETSWEDWRQWSFRRYRLKQYLLATNNPDL